MKEEQLQIRVSAKQKRYIASAAKHAGVDMSKWVLSKLFPRLRETFQEFLDSLVLCDAKEAKYQLAALSDFLENATAEELETAISDSLLEDLSDYLKNYVAAMVETACVKKNVVLPEWLDEIKPLKNPVFATELLSLRLYLLTNSPLAYRKRNIFIDSSLGARV